MPGMHTRQQELNRVVTHVSPSEQRLLNKSNRVKGTPVKPQHELYSIKTFLRGHCLLAGGARVCKADSKQGEGEFLLFDT